MEKLVRNARELFNVRITGLQAAALMIYEKELLEWNQKINLTAIRDADSIRTKHFLDSFSCVLAWQATPPASLIDVGTGAGFPGIPLKILYPALKLTLVESVGKKAKFCEHIINVLNLEQAQVIKAGAEDVGQDPSHRGRYDWATARAVASLNILSEYLLPLVKVGGAIMALKGTNAPAEIEAAKKAAKTLGGKWRELISVKLPDVSEERYLAVANKVSATPKNYPRKAGIPAKQPL
ncbi:MAG TPA: 16S rRNA (guanine(527)-N(7))-methyltransferase RsmG [Anaerolineales bacterium]|nr:16S rRNA (guanine(527)-N(7))-methyltransferase RsmG [Anaerolineales bacterium]